MLGRVPTPAKSLSDYAAVIGADAVAALRARAEPFKGARVLNVNSTAYGGGVAELLYTQVPLMRDLGIEAEWRILEGNEPFFGVTKAMHNALQGAPVPWTDEMRALYRTVNEDNAASLDEEYDFVIIHDPQPAAMLSELLEDGDPKGKWIWRCHIDLTQPYQPVWEFLEPFVGAHHAVVFTMEDFVRPGLPVPHVIIPPTIDPLSLKNIPMDEAMVSEVMRRYGLDVQRPLIVQVSRFDPWKDPLGVIDAYRIVKREVPGVQLALIASMATDDPEGWEYYTRTDEHRREDPDIFLLSNLQEVGNLAVNAIQRAASVIVQKSIREGFGLVVAEGMWKGKAVVGGNVGGIRLQLIEGETGYLVSSVEECGARICELLSNAELAAAVGKKARERVRQHFLSTREISDFLGMFEMLS
jgi:trehalose synthase